MNILTKPESVIYPDLSYKITGLLFSIHNQLGQYCSEKQYGDALEQVLKQADVAYEREYTIPVSFVGEAVGRNKIDFLIEDKLIVELKACKVITKQEYDQTLRYLRASHKKLAILVNFHARHIQPKRVLNSLSSN